MSEFEAEQVIKSTNQKFSGGLVLPVGAHLYTALVLSHRIVGGRKLARSAKALLGSTAGPQFYKFGPGIQQASQCYFNGAYSEVEVLEKFTMFGLYSRLLAEVDREEALSAVRAGIAPGFRGQLKFDLSPKLPILRWCPACKDQDLIAFGFGAWRIVHQLNDVLICPEHFLPLVSHCADCARPLDKGNNFGLPGDSCQACNSNRFVSPVVISSQNDQYRNSISLLNALVLDAGANLKFRPEPEEVRLSEHGSGAIRGFHEYLNSDNIRIQLIACCPENPALSSVVTNASLRSLNFWFKGSRRGRWLTSIVQAVHHARHYRDYFADQASQLDLKISNLPPAVQEIMKGAAREFRIPLAKLCDEVCEVLECSPNHPTETEISQINSIARRIRFGSRKKRPKTAAENVRYKDI